MVSALLTFGVLAALSSPVAAFNDEVTVHFRTEVSQTFVQTLSQTFKAPIIARVDKQTWRFKVPKLRTLDQYAELFASLPTVDATNPAPVYQIADHINPQAVNLTPVPNAQAVRTQDFLPGEMLVKFNPDMSSDDIRFFNSRNQITEISRISGVDVYRLRLPQNLSVPEAIALYTESGMVQYAEPNYTMQLPSPVNAQGQVQPQPPASPAASSAPNSANPNNQTGLPNGTMVYTQIPLDGGGQMIVTFRPKTPAATVTLFHQIYGTRPVRQESFDTYRIQLPPSLNPARALRIFMLHPNVTNAQRLYS